ncbi:MAG: ABC transporter substrate-binding protein [Bacteroidetes bacterium]|nr:ABC transporter substrate-binding protein [Bacteroidota bacterium]
MKQLREAKVNSKVISNISFLEPDCLNIAQSTAEELWFQVAYYNPNDSTSSGAFNFGKLYQEKHNSEPSVAVAVRYDAVIIFDDAIKKLVMTHKKVADHIRNLKQYNGALGKFNFENGDINMKTVFKVIQTANPLKLNRDTNRQ